MGEKNNIHLRWVKAHVGIHGNEVADSLAKKGTTLGNGAVEGLLTPQANQAKQIDDFFRKKWNKQWNSYEHARQTKIWFPQPVEKTSSLLLNLDRNRLSTLVQFTTGHKN